MLTAELHQPTIARHTFYAGFRDAEEPSNIVRPWVTVELFDDLGNSVIVFVRSAADGELLRDAGERALILLATGGEADEATGRLVEAVKATEPEAGR